MLAGVTSTLENQKEKPHLGWAKRPTSKPHFQNAALHPDDINMATPIYKVVFFNQGQIYEIYARQIYQSDLYGFIEIEELVFGEKSGMLVDPSEEKLKAEFEGVNRSYIPMHAIVRIDEVAKEGVGSITEATGNNVAPFPMPAFNPNNTSD